MNKCSVLSTVLACQIGCLENNRIFQSLLILIVVQTLSSGSEEKPSNQRHLGYFSERTTVQSSIPVAIKKIVIRSSRITSKLSKVKTKKDLSFLDLRSLFQLLIIW